MVPLYRRKCTRYYRKEFIKDTIDETSSDWIEGNQEAKKDEFDTNKQKDIENISSPIYNTIIRNTHV